MKKTFHIKTADHFQICLTIFQSESVNDAANIILINPATGISQKFYYDFATFLSEKGYRVFTYDYRGIGLSKPEKLKHFRANMRDWAQKDFKAVTEYLVKHYPDSKKYLIGHSIGGIFIGLTDAYKSFESIFTIGAQYAYHKNFKFPEKILVLWVFMLFLPISCFIYGYFPSKLKGLGQPLPSGAAFDWRTLIMNHKSIMALAEKSENHYPAIKKPMLICSIDDDWIANKKATDMLAEKVYANARVKRLHIVPSAFKCKSIGHVGFFRKKNKDKLWHLPLEWYKKA